MDGTLTHLDDWRTSGVCASVLGPAIRRRDHEAVKAFDNRMFDRKGRPPRQALLLCAECPVRQLCLEDAMAHGEQYGIWGGLSAANRERLSRVNHFGRDVVRKAVDEGWLNWTRLREESMEYYWARSWQATDDSIKALSRFRVKRFEFHL